MVHKDRIHDRTKDQMLGTRHIQLPPKAVPSHSKFPSRFLLQSSASLDGFPLIYHCGDYSFTRQEGK